MDKLYNENEALKKDIELYKVDNQSLIKQLAYTKTTCGEAGQLLIDAKKELSQVKEERTILEDDLLKMAKRVADLSRASNDKQPTPAEKEEDEIYIGKHGKLSNVKIVPSSESIDFNFKVLFDRLARVERAITEQLKIEL